jgi:hypothetical protein
LNLELNTRQIFEMNVTIDKSQFHRQGLKLSYGTGTSRKGDYYEK